MYHPHQCGVLGQDQPAAVFNAKGNSSGSGVDTDPPSANRRNAQRLPDCRRVQSKLILDHSVRQRVRFDTGQIDSLTHMVVSRERQPFVIVQFDQPSGCGSISGWCRMEPPEPNFTAPFHPPSQSNLPLPNLLAAAAALPRVECQTPPNHSRPTNTPRPPRPPR